MNSDNEREFGQNEHFQNEDRTYQLKKEIQISSCNLHKVDKNTNLNRATILICDDEKFNCDIIYGFLMILGVPNRKEVCEFAYNG